jgi:hypothetical protein
MLTRLLWVARFCGCDGGGTVDEEMRCLELKGELICEACVIEGSEGAVKGVTRR